MKILRIGLCIILFSQTIACSAFNASTQTVKFTCEPKDGVTLVVSGKKYPCPVTLELPRNQEFTIEGYKDEYLPYRRTVSYHNNETFTLDLIGPLIYNERTKKRKEVLHKWMIMIFCSAWNH